VKDHHKLAGEIARRIITRSMFRKAAEEEIQLQPGETRKDAYEFAVESATSSISIAIMQDRAEARIELVNAMADIAGREFAENPDWDRPKYSAKGAGDWIATVLRSQLTGDKKTNVPWRPGRKKKRKPEEINP